MRKYVAGACVVVAILMYFFKKRIVVENKE